MITFQLIDHSHIEELLDIGQKTFYDAFEHLNNPADFEAYCAKAFTTEKLLSEIENPGSAFYFAVLNNSPVAYMKLNYGQAQTDFQDANALEVERIYVLRSYQGMKIGKKLIDFAIGKAIENKLSYIWLGVWQHNYNAIRFYQREGFKQFSSHQFALSTDIQTDILMKMELWYVSA